MSPATLTDTITYGDNATRGPAYNKSVASLASSAYVQVLPVNANRKFLLIKPASNASYVHFLSPGAASATISNDNSVIVDSTNAASPLLFDAFVPTNAVWMKASSATTTVTIFEN